MRRLAFALFLVSAAAAQTYKADWASLDARPIPPWFDDAKFGIFIHWGVYSVPAWGPRHKYAEWYWHDMENHASPTWAFHQSMYGAKTKYQDFAPQFKAEMFQPAEWAGLFERSGAKYVVLTSKHHEGFALWPSAESWNWNSVDIGPHRDLLGDLTKAVRARGLKMGIYYSLYEWFNPLYLADVGRYVNQHMMPQLKDVVTRYSPSIIFSDGEWEHPSEQWHSTEFLQWLYNDSPSKNDVVVNDRWGKETRSLHGGYYTSEYGKARNGQAIGQGHKWEEDQGIGYSFGYNRNEDLGDYKTSAQLIRLLVDAVSTGGNLLLDVGPTADGRIPVIMQQRLVEMGDWLKVNGEAIYGTKPWSVQSEGDNVRFTSKGSAVYAIVYQWPGKALQLKAVHASGASLLGIDTPLAVHSSASGTEVDLSNVPLNRMTSREAYVLKMTGVQK